MSQEINKIDEEIDNPLKAAKAQLNLSLGVFSESDHPLKASIAETDLSIKRSLKTFSAQSDELPEKYSISIQTDFVKKENKSFSHEEIEKTEHQTAQLIDTQETETQTKALDKSDQHIEYPLKASQAETNLLLEKLKESDHQTTQVTNTDTQTSVAIEVLAESFEALPEQLNDRNQQSDQPVESAGTQTEIKV